MFGGGLCDGSGGAARKGQSHISGRVCLGEARRSTSAPTESGGARRVGSGSPLRGSDSQLLYLCRAPVEEVAAVASGAAGGDDGGASTRPLTKAQPGHRSYNLQERRRIGSMTGAEQALLPRVPTDESEAQTLATADLDLMKSECWPGKAQCWWEQEEEGREA